MKARALGEQGADQRCLVRSVIVHDHVHFPLGRHTGVNAIQELAKLDGPMTAMRLADHFAGLGVEGSKQRGGAVALVVVRAPFGLARSHRQERCGPAPESAIFRPRTAPPRARAGECTSPRYRALSAPATGRAKA